MADPTLTIEVETGEYHPGEIVTIARNKVANGGPLGTVRMQFAELNTGATAIDTLICDSTLEMATDDEAVLSNNPNDPNQCDLSLAGGILGHLSARMIHTELTTQVWGVRVWDPDTDLPPDWIPPTSGPVVTGAQATWKTTTAANGVAPPPGEGGLTRTQILIGGGILVGGAAVVWASQRSR